MLSANIENSPAGLKFDLAPRNAILETRGHALPKPTSTGTTIVGAVFDGGVILGADKRATAGSIVADKACEKLHYISPNIWCAGAGTAADTEMVTRLISSQVELHSLSTNRKPRAVTALQMLKQHLFRYQGYIGAYLILAGVDVTGPHLFGIQAHGSSDVLPYMTLGSGSLAATGVLELKWKPNMERHEAMELVSEAIEAGIWNDLGSGSNVDLCVITKEGTELFINYKKVNEMGQKTKNYTFERGTTAILKESIRDLVEVVDVVPESGASRPMDLD